MDNRNDGNRKDTTNGGTGNKRGRTPTQFAIMLIGVMLGCMAFVVTIAKGNAIGVPLLVFAGAFSGLFEYGSERIEVFRKNRRVFFEILCTIAAYTVISICIVPNPPHLMASHAVSFDFIARAFIFLFEVVIVYIGGVLLGGMIRTLG